VTKPYTSKEEQTMNKVYTIFSELLKLCPGYRFEKAVEEYQGLKFLCKHKPASPHTLRHSFAYSMYQVSCEE